MYTEDYCFIKSHTLKTTALQHAAGMGHLVYNNICSHVNKVIYNLHAHSNYAYHDQGKGMNRTSFKFISLVVDY